MNIKTIIDIIAALFIFIWPGFILASMMAFDSPNSANSGKVILTSIALISYPIIIFAVYTIIKVPFFSFPAIYPLIISVLISVSVMIVFGHFRLISNFRKGIKNSGYTVTENKVFYNGNPINEADPKTFKELPKSGYVSYSKDAKNVYYNGKIIRGANPAEFKKLEKNDSSDPDAFDGTNYYNYGKIHKKSSD